MRSKGKSVKAFIGWAVDWGDGYVPYITASRRDARILARGTTLRARVYRVIIKACPTGKMK